MKKIVVLIGLPLILAACSTNYASNGEGYLKSRNGKPLQVPTHLSSSNLNHFYDLPQREKKIVASIEPPASSRRV